MYFCRYTGSQEYKNPSGKEGIFCSEEPVFSWEPACAGFQRDTDKNGIGCDLFKGYWMEAPALIRLLSENKIGGNMVVVYHAFGQTGAWLGRMPFSTGNG